MSRDGIVDWMCLPRFDADPVFGHLIDSEHGGSFELAVCGGRVAGRRYRDRSAVLETEWRSDSGTATVTDAMVLNVHGLRPQMALVRTARCHAGHVRLRLAVNPRGGLPGRAANRENRSGYTLFTWHAMALVLQTFPATTLSADLRTEVDVAAGSSFTVILSMADRGPAVMLSEDLALALIEETDRAWRDWCGDIAYQGSHRNSVIRSLITLKLLTYSPSGAPVAAPTSSLPEIIGGNANWDYRYSWARDAGIGSGAFVSAGRAQEAEAFLRWLRVASVLTRPRMLVLYTLDGTSGHEERECSGVSGYRGSLPVRISNAAARQHQLDVYGWVIDTAWHLHERGHSLEPAARNLVRQCADYVQAHWREPDAGIWELRGTPRQNTSSKLLAFVAADRAARLAEDLGIWPRRAASWRTTADAIRDDVRRQAWSDTRQTYTAAYGATDLDASLLLLPMSGLEPPDSPRVTSTIDAVRGALTTGEGLIYRYREAKVQQEGAFLACSFWLVDALVRTGRVGEAARVMECGLRWGGELGLFGEEFDVRGGMMGNFPLALTHSSLVMAACALEQAGVRAA